MHLPISSYGLGRATIATAIFGAIVVLTGCSSADSESTSATYQKELVARGFSDVVAIHGSALDDNNYNLRVGNCRGTAVATGNLLKAYFTGSDGKQHYFRNPTAIAIGLDPQFKYCQISTAAPTPTATKSQ